MTRHAPGRRSATAPSSRRCRSSTRASTPSASPSRPSSSTARELAPDSPPDAGHQRPRARQGADQGESRLELVKVVGPSNPSPMHDLPDRGGRAASRSAAQSRSNRRVLPYDERDEPTAGGHDRAAEAGRADALGRRRDPRGRRRQRAAQRRRRPTVRPAAPTTPTRSTSRSSPRARRSSARGRRANVNAYMAVVLNDRSSRRPTSSRRSPTRGRSPATSRSSRPNDLALTLRSGALPGEARLPRRAHGRPEPRRGLDPRGRDGLARRPRARRPVHGLLLPRVGHQRRRRAAAEHGAHARGAHHLRRDADAARHRRPHPRHRHGRGLERAHLRAHPRGVADGQDRGLGRRRRASTAPS